jgi:accessory gene regulator protein AgrB
MIDILTKLHGSSDDDQNNLELLLQGFQTLLLNVTNISAVTSVSSYRSIIKQYFNMLGSIFGEKYKKYALEKYKLS